MLRDQIWKALFFSNGPRPALFLGPLPSHDLQAMTVSSYSRANISASRHGGIFFGFVSQREGVLGKCRDAPRLLQPSLVASKVKVKEEVKENGGKSNLGNEACAATSEQILKPS